MKSDVEFHIRIYMKHYTYKRSCFNVSSSCTHNCTPRYSGVRSLQKLFSRIKTQMARPHYNWQLKMDMSSKNGIPGWISRWTVVCNLHRIIKHVVIKKVYIKIANPCSSPIYVPAYWRNLKHVLMEEEIVQHHSGIVNWRKNGGVKWFLIFSMLLHVVPWMLSNTLLPVGRNQVSGIIDGVAKPALLLYRLSLPNLLFLA